MTDLILHSELLRRAGVKHGFTTRQLGSLLKPAALAVWEKACGLSPGALVRLNQVHGTKVLLVDRKADKLPAESARGCDASITNRADVVLSVRTADCVPILLYSAEPAAISAVHAGWRGTLAGTVTSAVLALENTYGCKPKNLIAAVGPGIRACCYQVGLDVYQLFLQRFGPQVAAVRGNSFYVDLAGANCIWLDGCGLLGSNLEVLQFCTYCREDLFFSHRRGGSVGRQLAYITLGWAER